MPFYKAEVTESVAVRRTYVVEAADVEEAREKLKAGDTVREESVREDGVTDRTITGDVEETTDPASTGEDVDPED